MVILIEADMGKMSGDLADIDLKMQQNNDENATLNDKRKKLQDQLDKEKDKQAKDSEKSSGSVSRV